MTITMEVPTGEHRPLKPREWGQTASGEVWCNVGLQDSTHEYDIVTRYEIEVPEGATDFRYLFRYGNASEIEFVNIPLPRKKVKKEGWVNVYKLPLNKSNGSSNTIYNTEQEAKDAGELLLTYVATVHVEWEEDQ